MLKCPICDQEKKDELFSHIINDHDQTLEEVRQNYPDAFLASKEFYEFITEKNNINRKGNLQQNSYFEFQKLRIKKHSFKGPFVPGEDKNYYFPTETKWLMMAVREKKNVFLTGPPGTGKSSIIMQLYNRIGRNLYHISSHGDLTYEDLIYKEVIHTNPESGNVETFPKYGSIVQSLLDNKGKGAILFDEISFADPKVLQALQPLLESSTRYLTIPETGEIIKAHDDWLFFATDNTRGQGDDSGMFSGTETMNFALINRFPYFLEINYLPEKIEREILINKLQDHNLELSTELLNKVFKFTQSIRSAILSGKYFMTFSLRDLFEWLLKLKYFPDKYGNIIDCAKVTFINKQENSTQEALINLLKNIFDT